MPSQALDHPQLYIVSSPVPAEASAHEVDGPDPELAARMDAAISGLGCVRGARYAIAIEAVFAVALYCAWQLRHLLH